MGASVSQIYNRLNAWTQYTPLSADLFTDWSLEAGDVISASKGGTEYQTPVMQSTVRWNGASSVSVESTGKKRRDPVSNQSKRAYNRKSGGGYYNNQGLQIIDQDIITVLGEKRQVYVQWDDPYNNLTIRPKLQKGDLWVKTNRMRTYNDLATKKYGDLAAYKWKDLHGSIVSVWDELSTGGMGWRKLTDDQTANLNYQIVRENRELYQRVIGDLQGTYAEIEMTKEQYHRELYDAKNDTWSRIEQTADHIRSEVSASNNSLHSEILQTASEIRLDVSNDIEGLSSQISVQAGRISLVVQGEGTNAKIRPAQIVAAINNPADGSPSSSVIISADRVNLEGYVTASQLGANWLSSNIANLNLVTVQSLQFANGSTPYGSTNYKNLRQMVEAYKIVKDGDNYKLQVKTYNSSEWADAPNSETFSRATTLNGSWSSSGGIYTVTASPQSVSKSIGFSGNPSANHVLLVIAGNGAGTAVSTNKKYINVPIIVNEVGQSGSTITERHTTTVGNVDATECWNDGNLAVDLAAPYWTYNAQEVDTGNRASNTITVETTGRNSLKYKSQTLHLTEGNWASNSKTIYVRKDNATNGDMVLKKVVDATEIWNAGNMAVTLKNPTWTYSSSEVEEETYAQNTFTVQTSGRNTALSKSQSIFLTAGEWSNNKLPVYVRKGSTSGDYLAKRIVNASSIYNSGWVDGSKTVVPFLTASTTGTHFDDRVTNVTENKTYYIRGIYKSAPGSSYDTYQETNRTITVNVPAPAPSTSDISVPENNCTAIPSQGTPSGTRVKALTRYSGTFYVQFDVKVKTTYKRFYVEIN